MTDVYTPAVRAFVAASLLLATATLMFVAVTTARAASARGAFGATYHDGNQTAALAVCDRDGGRERAIRAFFCDAKG